MTTRTRFTLAVAILALIATGLAFGKDVPDNWDGLVRVKAKKMGAVYVAPGADFRSYTKVMLDAPLVAFRKNWMKDINKSNVGISGDVTEEDAKKILEKARTGFTEVFTKEFEKAGITLVTQPGDDVLRLSPAVVDLYINAPDTMSAGRSRTYTTEAGEATLVLEARDSTSGALLGRVFDRRETRQSGGVQWTTSVSNRADFSQLFKSWANICVKGMSELKEISPVPADLQPNQKL